METPRTETPHTEIPRTKSIITIAALLVLLAALSVTSALTTGQFGGFVRTRPQGAFNGTPVPGGNFPGGADGNFQGSPGGDVQGGGNFQGRNGGGGGNFQGGAGGNFRGGAGGFGGFNMFGVTRQLGIDPRVMIYVSLGATLLGILLALLCAFGVWKQKKWALNLAMLLALLFLLAALPGLFMGGRFNLLRTAMNVLNVGASAVILVLGILPSVRETVS